ncbi:hypothetical protein [Bacillus amyloliquefaciens]|uniref:hypothetical protein n=1 Tax=Bacillus amyloliquefaciens TaxID=1390 RepID=UPI000D6C04AA|nr:hypothetical protein [Bacillus amyloliquefaciens]AWM47435.1 hypothetical protein DDT09_06080 [Bacillus amyloliquefaciens]
MAETKKYVWIKKAKYESSWYVNKIGELFELTEDTGAFYDVSVPGSVRLVNVEDAELIVTENRRPKVGERVLITYGITSSGDYKTGDICTVRSVVDIYGTITVKEHSNYVIAREYEVIINNEVENEEADGMEKSYAFKPNLNAMGYDELIAHGEDVMRAIRLRAYGEGYRQGKFDAEMDSTHGQAPVVSAQARRDEIVEQAKTDVEKLSNYGDGMRYETGTGSFATCNVEFVVNRDKRTVVALLKGIRTGNVYARGIAKAASDDCFNVHIGKAIALRRALDLTVPDEYLNAPLPTEVRVGDVVYYSRMHPRLTVSEGIGKGEGFVSVQLVSEYLGDGLTKIIDDSREEVCK